MGVTSLWQILEPVKQYVPLGSLKGKTLAVDLSLWVCEAQTVKKMIGVVTKPHLRNLYFRVSSLTRMGIHLVFVMEGDPPKLKANTMHKRTETRFGPSKKPATARTGRSHFKFLLKECLEMLEYLGVPWVQAAGEAEAMCAYLNANGYVDGCVTNDGDAFLYGAQTVYRNFTMNVKHPHVDCYSISAIEEKLNCSRESLIGLAVLLGCDYLPKLSASGGCFSSVPAVVVVVAHHRLSRDRLGFWHSVATTAFHEVVAEYKKPIQAWLKVALRHTAGSACGSIGKLGLLCSENGRFHSHSDGVPGVGKEQALKLIRTLRGQSLLQRFEHWLDHFQYGSNPVIAVKKVIHCAICHHPGSHKDHEHTGCQLCESVDYCEPHDAEYRCPCDWHSSRHTQQVDQVEDGIRKKAKACEGFPFPEVIQEYLVCKDKQPKLNESQRPNLLSFQRFACEKMDWTKHYACEKLCALLTYYDMNRRKSGHVDPQQLQALRIVKTRMKNGTPCFEIEWEKPDHFATADDQFAEPFFVTTEESSLFQAAYPEIVALYQMEKLHICKEKRRGKKTKLRACPAEDSEVAELLSQLELQPACETFPDRESRLNFETALNHHRWPENDSLFQGPTVTGNISTTFVKNQNPPFALPITSPQNAANEYNSGSSLSSQVDFTNQPTYPCASSAIADLQLSDIDWEGTSFSLPLMHVNGVCSESESGTCHTSVRRHSPLHHKTAEIITPYSDSVNYDQDLPSNMAFVSNSNSPEGLILKESSFRPSSKCPNAFLVNPLQAVKQIKGVASSRAMFSSSSAQPNASTWETENVLSEKYSQRLRLQNSEEMLKNLEIPGEVAQKPIGSGNTVPKGLCAETVEPTCSANMLLRWPLKPTKAIDNWEVRKQPVQTIFKSSLKKSVCQNGGPIEDSVDENMKKTKPCRGSKWQRKHNLHLLKDKWSNSESTLEIKLRGEEPDFQVISTDISMKEHPKLSSVVHVHNSLSPTESMLSVSNPHLQESGSDSEVWVRSPLPLSERLKLRLQSH